MVILYFLFKSLLVSYRYISTRGQGGGKNARRQHGSAKLLIGIQGNKHARVPACALVMSDSAAPWLGPTKLLRPWSFPGENTWAGCHFLCRGSSPPRDPTYLSCVGRQVLYQLSHRGSPKEIKWKSLSRVWLFVTAWTIQSMGFSRPEYWSGQPFPSPGALSNPGINPRSPALQGNSLPAEPSGRP